MKNFKKLLALTMALIMVLAAVPAMAAKDGERDVVYILSNSAADKVVREAQVERFNNTIGAEKGITIQYSVYGANYNDMLPIALQSGEAVDLFTCGEISLVPQFIESGYMIPLEDMPGGPELIASCGDKLVNRQHIFDGYTYTLPARIQTYAYVINTDLFEKAGLTEEDYPTTWEKARIAAKKITEAGNGEFFGFGLSLREMWTIGSYFANPNSMYTGHCGWNGKEFAYSDFAPMAKAVYDIVQDGSVIPGYETLDADSVRAQFAEGRIGMLGAASFDCGVYKDQFPAKCNWKVIPAPAITEDQIGTGAHCAKITDLYFVGVNAEKHKENVMTVYEYMYSDQCNAELYEAGLSIPFSNKAVELATKEPDIPGFDGFANLSFKAWPPSPDGLLLLEGATFNEVIASYWTGLAGDNIEELLADVDARYNAALADIDPEVVAQYIYE